MRILIHGINYAPELTGIGKYTSEMSAWLHSRGHEVCVITAPPYYPAWEIGPGYSGWKYRREQLEGVNIWRCPVWVPRQPSGLTRILHLASFMLSSLPIMLIQTTWRPDIVMVIEPPLFCAPQALLTARLSGAKAWMHIQDFEVDAAFELGILPTGPLQKLVTLAESWTMRGFDCISSISSAMVNRLIAKGVDENRTLFFPNWVDTNQIYPDNRKSAELRRELDIPDQMVIALYSGNLGEKQGLDILIEAAKELEHQQSIIFFICGEGSARKRLQERSKNLSNIRFLPLQPIERLNDMLNLADIHLLPQRADVEDLVLPSKLTGMLACGGAIVATSRPGTQVERIVQEAGGIVCQPGDLQAFVEGISIFASDPIRRTHAGDKARTYALTQLSREKILLNVESHLREVQ